jgi:hypothetical protein
VKKLGRTFLVLAAGLLSGLALVASAAGTTASSSTTVRHLRLPVAALAVDGGRVAYDLDARNASSPNATNRVVVWNVRTGKTTKVSGKKTAIADNTSTGAGVFQLAIAGSRVAWLVNEGGNLEGDDYLFTSSATNPGERQVASAMRTGDNCPGREATRCAGPWLGGLVGSGSVVALNRWTTDSQGDVTSGGLYVLNGTHLKSIATGAGTVLAVSSDAGREAVLRPDGSVAVYSASGNVQVTVNPPNAQEVALSDKSLLVLSKHRQLALYDAHTGSLRKTFFVHGTKQPRNLDVQGNIAIYTVGSALHAVNLSSGKDRAIRELRGGPILADIDGAGLVYAANRYEYRPGTRVAFVPLARVEAAVS